MKAPQAPPSSAPKAPTIAHHRDWFGYFMAVLIPTVTTALTVWITGFGAQTNAATAETERARAVKSAAVAIVEEHVLNGKALEATRLARLIDQRRRDESISSTISVTEVLEQAEFNIASSHHLSVDRKEAIKPLFDSVYAQLASISFSGFPQGTTNTELLNEIARKIQEGKPAEALSALRRLEETHIKDLGEARRVTNAFIEGLRSFASSPFKQAMLVVAYVVIFIVIMRLRRRQRSFYR